MRRVVLLCVLLLGKRGSAESEPPASYHFPMDEITGGQLVGESNGEVKYGVLHGPVDDLHNLPALTDGYRGNAVRFNGDGQWADLGLIPCITDLSRCSDQGYTLSAWLRLEQEMWDGGHNYILSSGGQYLDVDTGGIAVVMKANALRVEVRIRSTEQSWLTNGIDVEPDYWFHVVATWKPTGSLVVYLDGIIKTEISRTSFTPISSALNSKMYIGRPNNVDQAWNYGTFTIDELKFWDFALTIKQAETVYYEGECGNKIAHCFSKIVSALREHDDPCKTVEEVRLNCLQSCDRCPPPPTPPPTPAPTRPLHLCRNCGMSGK